MESAAANDFEMDGGDVAMDADSMDDDVAETNVTAPPQFPALSAQEMGVSEREGILTHPFFTGHHHVRLLCVNKSRCFPIPCCCSELKQKYERLECRRIGTPLSGMTGKIS